MAWRNLTYCLLAYQAVDRSGSLRPDWSVAKLANSREGALYRDLWDMDNSML